MTEAGGTVALLAGSGHLPVAIAERVRRAGGTCRILALKGFAERETIARADAVLGMLDVGRALRCLAEWKPDCVTLAGGVSRPKPALVFDAFSLLRGRDEIARLLARGDDNLLRGVLALLEENGHRLVGIRDLAPDLLAASGPIGRVLPPPGESGAIETGFRLIADLSPFDIGQATAVRGARVLAVEGPEGTDAMLARVRGIGRGFFALGRPPERGGVLAKGPKRGQDLRVDLPAIGPRTVALAARAGLSGIAVASGLTLILRREDTATLADRLGLFVAGFDTPELAP